MHLSDLLQHAQRLPTPMGWCVLVEALDRAPLSDAALTRLDHALDAWPDALRRAPRAWLLHNDPKLRLARTAQLPLTLTPYRIAQLPLAHLTALAVPPRPLTPATLARILSACDPERLHTLDLSGACAGAHRPALLDRALALPALRALHLARCPWTLDHVERIFTRAPTTLGLLDLSQAPKTGSHASLTTGGLNALGDPLARWIASDPRLPQLHTLRIDHHGVSCDGVRALIRAPHRAALRHLSAQSTTPPPRDQAERLAHTPEAARLTSLALASATIAADALAPLRRSPHTGHLFGGLPHDFNAHMSRLRERAAAPPSPTAFRALCAALGDWPRDLDRSLAVAYAKAHTQTWPHAVCIDHAPPTRLLTSADPDPTYALARHTHLSRYTHHLTTDTRTRFEDHWHAFGLCSLDLGPDPSIAPIVQALRLPGLTHLHAPNATTPDILALLNTWPSIATVTHLHLAQLYTAPGSPPPPPPNACAWDALTHLHIETRSESPALEAFSIRAAMPRLTALTWRGPLSSAAFGNIAKARPTLQKVRLIGTTLSEDNLGQLISGALPHLAHLDLHRCKSRDANALGHTLHDHSLHTLKRLDLSATTLAPGTLSDLAATSLPALTAFIASRCDLAPADALALAGADWRTNLHTLDLAHNPLGRHVTAPLRAGLPLLRTLNLARTRLPTLAPLLTPHWTALEQLNLAHNPLSDQDLRAFIARAHLPALTHLDLTGLPLSDDAAIALADAPNLPALSTLRISLATLSARALAALIDTRRLAPDLRPMALERCTSAI